MSAVPVITDGLPHLADFVSLCRYAASSTLNVCQTKFLAEVAG